MAFPFQLRHQPADQKLINVGTHSCRSPQLFVGDEMGKLLDRAFQAVKALPEQDQDSIAWEILERVENKMLWDRLVSSDAAQKWLKSASEEALKKFKKMSRPLEMAFISVDMESFLREENYWKRFNDLPDHVRKLAEKNYRLLQDDPNHPSLRFRKIHKELPIYSFRVGLKYRSIGVKTDDRKLLWFWVGDFDDFRAISGAQD